MGKEMKGFLVRWPAGVTLALLLASSPSVFAAIHVVQFGGSVGFSYSPSSFTASVGDTVRWEGDFNTHPLSSTGVPPGADSFVNGPATGSVSPFDYVIKVPGSYTYQCDIHEPSMSGSFSAIVAGLESDPGARGLESFRLDQNYPNPFNPVTVVGYHLPVRSAVQLSVYNLLGGKVATLVSGVEAAGSHQARFDATALPSGVYLYRLAARNVDGGGASQILVRRMAVVK